MEENYATNIHQTKSTLYGECNVGEIVIKKKEKIGTENTWINQEGISKNK